LALAFLPMANGQCSTLALAIGFGFFANG